MKKISELREIAKQEYGREGLSKIVLARVGDFDGSYKGAMKLAGELSVVAKMATYDEYWNEQVEKGIDALETLLILDQRYQKHPPLSTSNEETT